MTNSEKYKTVDERANAFSEFCDSQKDCGECPIFGMASFNRCPFKWLELEYKESWFGAFLRKVWREGFAVETIEENNND